MTPRTRNERKATVLLVAVLHIEIRDEILNGPVFIFASSLQCHCPSDIRVLKVDYRSNPLAKTHFYDQRACSPLNTFFENFRGRGNVSIH